MGQPNTYLNIKPQQWVISNNPHIHRLLNQAVTFAQTAAMSGNSILAQKHWQVARSLLEVDG